MKKSNQTILLVIILFAGFVITGCSNPNNQSVKASKGVHTIVLKVNTTDIHPGADVEKYASFVDQPLGESLINFTTNVNFGDTILWIGISSTNINDDVLIEQINYQGGDNLLGQNVINGKNGMVIGIIKGEGDEEKYVIHFKVEKQGGGPNNTYLIDPKLRILN